MCALEFKIKQNKTLQKTVIVISINKFLGSFFLRFFIQALAMHELIKFEVEIRVYSIRFFLNFKP